MLRMHEGNRPFRIKIPICDCSRSIQMPLADQNQRLLLTCALNYKLPSNIRVWGSIFHQNWDWEGDQGAGKGIKRYNFSFAKTGIPQTGSGLPWKKFNSKWYGVNGEKTLILGDKLNVKSKDIHNFFRFDDDFQKIKRQLSKDDIMKKAIKNFPGMRILRQDPFQCYISFIVSSNSNIPSPLISRSVNQQVQRRD